jgi:hypothetical protein
MVLYSRSKKYAAGLLTFPDSASLPIPERDSGIVAANLVVSLAASAGLQQRVLFRTLTGFPFKPACFHGGHHMFQ